MTKMRTLRSEIFYCMDSLRQNRADALLCQSHEYGIFDGIFVTLKTRS